MNKFGLSRNIPAEVKRSVRQRDGFGCIVCGSAFPQYDHVGIEFKDAKVHSADQIILLCGGCHDLKTRGALSTETLQRHAKSPFCRRVGYARGPLDIGIESPEIVIGTINTTNVSTLIEFEGEPLFTVSPPEADGEPFLINAKLFGPDEKPMLYIENNVFLLSPSNWDVKVEGQKIEIRCAPGVFYLKMRVEPPRRIVIENLVMAHKQCRIECKEGSPTTLQNGLKKFEIDASANGGDSVICLNSNGLALSSGGAGLYIKEYRSEALPRKQFTSWSFPFASIDPRRNALCNCGSGQRYKNCHGAIKE